YSQIACLCGALLCLALGGLALGNGLYWRLYADRVAGRIVGARQNGSSYYPVYRYALTSGQTIEATSDTGSSRPPEPGIDKDLSLMVFRTAPGVTRPTHSYLLEIIGLMIFVPGLFLLHMGLTAYPTTKMTYVMLVALGLYGAIRLHKIIIPKDKRVPMAAWKAAHGEAQADLEAQAVEPLDKLAASPAVSLQRAAEAKGGKQARLVFLLLGPLLILGSAYMTSTTAELTRDGLRAPGVVAALETELDSNHSGTVYYALVDFTLPDKGQIRFKDRSGGNPPLHRVGDAVTVLYLADRPERSAIIDRGPWNWLGALILGGGGLALLVAGIALRRKPENPL
ncbi:MAG: DUF3592 domain-containing protein, partial [Pseudomonadota bacterium]|nr:DUF3592 domain-containing protein [Pseudomonadota bacterium]